MSYIYSIPKQAKRNKVKQNKQRIASLSCFGHDFGTLLEIAPSFEKLLEILVFNTLWKFFYTAEQAKSLYTVQLQFKKMNYKTFLFIFFISTCALLLRPMGEPSLASTNHSAPTSHETLWRRPIRGSFQKLCFIL